MVGTVERSLRQEWPNQGSTSTPATYQLCDLDRSCGFDSCLSRQLTAWPYSEVAPGSPNSTMGVEQRNRKTRISGYKFKWLQRPWVVWRLWLLQSTRGTTGPVSAGLPIFLRSENFGFLNIGNQIEIVSNTIRIKQSMMVGFMQHELWLYHLSAKWFQRSLPISRKT